MVPLMYPAPWARCCRIARDAAATTVQGAGGGGVSGRSSIAHGLRCRGAGVCARAPCAREEKGPNPLRAEIKAALMILYYICSS